MDFLILESREGSGYADSATVYEFPRRYLKEFERLSSSETVALIYEPKRQGGRQAFVGWALVTGTPVETEPGSFIVRLGAGIMSFNRPVPFAVGGSPVEHRLRALAPTGYGAALQGRAVRAIPADNALEILELGMGQVSSDFLWTHSGSADAQLNPDRKRDLVERLRREAAFRDGVLRQWDFQCAVTGLSAGPNPASRLFGLLEAAHVKPVASGGPDALDNGLTLSPTVHRLFDAGLFTIRAEGGVLLVRTSPQLRQEMLRSSRGSHIRVEDGAPLQVPARTRATLGREYIQFHQQHVFLKCA